MRFLCACIRLCCFTYDFDHAINIVTTSIITKPSNAHIECMASRQTSAVLQVLTATNKQCKHLLNGTTADITCDAGSNSNSPCKCESTGSGHIMPSAHADSQVLHLKGLHLQVSDREASQAAHGGHALCRLRPNQACGPLCLSGQWGGSWG